MKPNQQNSQRRDLLLTVIAHEATDDARALLRKYNRPDAKNARDLENKLADLYRTSPDQKLEIEKELADIHPHKNWLLKYVAPVVEVKTEPVAEQKIDLVTGEQRSGADGETKSSCSGCSKCSCMTEKKSGADGVNTSNDSKGILQINAQTAMVTIAAMAMVTVVALMINNKKQ